MSNPLCLKGFHYRSTIFYEACAFLKLGWEYNLRYKIAARHIKAKDAVLDICAGTGRLKDFLPADCRYTAVEASPEFMKALHHKGIDVMPCNLHRDFPKIGGRQDVLVMIISLAQFRLTSLGSLLEQFKKVARRVVIVEDVLPQARPAKTWFQRIVNYLCATDYYVPVEWLTKEEFKGLMDKHHYDCKEEMGRYVVGVFDGSRI